MQQVDFEEVLDQILLKDSRYNRDAYFFLRDALDHTQKMIAREKKGDVKHVKGQQLLEGIRRFSLDQFGPMAITVLGEWGIVRCEDFGDIVFNMIDHGLLAKTDEDTREDFRTIYDFKDAFQAPFLPKNKVARIVP